MDSSSDEDLSPVRRRIEARRWAEDCYEAIADKASFAERVVQLAGLAQQHNQHPTRPPAMTDQEAKAFEGELLPFGAYKGKRVCEAPLGYLCNLTDPSRETKELFAKIKRYLRNPQIQRLLEETED